ncbi:MAG TPA: flagellar basal body rod protein FlgB [Burkholderiaceae bacterium]|nr:flagellar basal body rod protein FlgB [Burkholderiaceae bacterium]
MTRLTDNLDFHANALLLRAQRQQLLGQNIANADTPGFAARDIDFASALADATGGAAAPRSVKVATSDTRHLPLPAAAGERIDSTAIKYRVTAQPSIDGNSVDLDRERANFADNALRYEAALRFINGSVRTILSAIRGE